MKILIVRFSSIGDIVLTSTVLRCLKLQTNAEIHFLTKQSFLGLVSNNIYVDRCFGIQKDINEVKNELKQQHYDLVIDLHNNLRSRMLSISLGVKTHRFDKLNFRKWLLVRFKIHKMPDVHIVDRYMDTLKTLGVTNDNQGLDFFINPESVVNIQSEIGITAPYIAFVIGAAHATKRLPEHKIIDFCKKTTQPIVLLGGKDEQDTGARIAQASGAHVTNTCGQFSLQQSASIVQQSAQVVTHDTGMMHIAAALRKPIVAIWGSTVPEFGMYPYFPLGQASFVNHEVKNLGCRPCSKIGFQTCPKGHFNCMEDQNLTIGF
jgi:ADP-heptose:LPS heptosyltransferase